MIRRFLPTCNAQFMAWFVFSFSSWCGYVIAWLQAVKYGGHEEYNKMVEIHDKPKTPSEKISAM